MKWIARFPGVPESVKAARRMTREALEPLSQAEDAVLIVSELVTNAVMHSRSGAGGSLWVEIWLRRGTVRVAVTDEGSADGGPAHRPPADSGDFGRGLKIVNALAEHWGATSEASGRRTVWAELSPAREDGAPAVRREPRRSPAAAPAAGDGPPVHRAVQAAVPPPAARRCRLCGGPLPPRQGAAAIACR
ncbi:ATP-binding protein [Kitasatospora sp. NPDC051914]|uniref:ATP-binding protein n=1 Tax=Kitasatospora sp. NPDC051914 TaxID=3154945 RepID=UPI00341DB4F8